MAALYAVPAEAYTLLELTDEARTAARECLKLATGVHDIVHLELLLSLMRCATLIGWDAGAARSSCWSCPIVRADGALHQAKNDGRDLIRIADARFVTGSHAIRRAQRK